MLAGFLLVVALSSLALPGLNGFVGEFLVFSGRSRSTSALAVVATAGMVLSAIYLLWSFQRIMHGPPRAEHVRHPDLSLREYAILVPIVAAIVLVGVYPKPLLERIEPSVAETADIVRRPRTGTRVLGQEAP